MPNLGLGSIPTTTNVLIVWENPNDPTQVRQLTGTGAPQWVARAAATFAECAELYEPDAAGRVYPALPDGLDDVPTAFAVYAADAAAFDDTSEEMGYEPASVAPDNAGIAAAKTAAQAAATDAAAIKAILPETPASKEDVEANTALLDAIAADTGATPTAAEIAQALGATTNLNVYAAATAGTIDIYKGDEYASSEGTGRRIPFNKAASETHWPTTLTTAHFSATPTADTLRDDPDAASLSDVECTITQATGDTQTLYLELTEAQTSTLTAGIGAYTFKIVANKETSPATIRSGTLTVRP